MLSMCCQVWRPGAACCRLVAWTFTGQPQLVAQGTDYQALARLARSGELHRVRHGAYADEASTSSLDRHRALVDGTWPLLYSDAVLSHASAGVWHGLPAWDAMLALVHITRPVGGHGRVSANLHVHYAEVPSAEILRIDGLPVTSLERTAVDLARSVSFERAVAIMDGALHLGGREEALASAVRAGRKRHGIAIAREALAFADGRSESVGESISRVRLSQAGLPTPHLQFEIRDRNGIWIARTDFAWPEFGVVGEFDGRVKYIGAPDHVTSVVMAEKSREQAIQAAGWTVIRWGWQDLSHPAMLAQRLRPFFTSPSR